MGPLLLIEDGISVLFVSSSLYGAFLILFILSTFVLHRQSKQNAQHSSGHIGTRIYLSLGYLIFVFITSSWILSAVIYMNSNLISDPQHSIFLFLQTQIGNSALFVADLILAYRLYIIWNKRALMFGAGVAMVLTYTGLVIPTVAYFFRYRNIWGGGTALLTSVNLCITTGMTALISWKIWKNNSHLGKLDGRNIILRVVAILVESAALQTVWMMLFLILHFADYNASHVLLHGAPAITGIATSLVNVRVGLGWAAGEEGRTTLSLHQSAFSDPPGAGVEGRWD